MDERAQLVAEIDVLNREIAVLGFELEPVLKRERVLRDRIAASHGGPGKFNEAGAEQRAPWFETLTDIAVTHGPKKQIVADMKRRVTAYLKEVQRLDKATAKAGNKAPAVKA